jgi:hypothetical protein
MISISNIDDDAEETEETEEALFPLLFFPFLHPPATINSTFCNESSEANFCNEIIGV